MKRKMLFAGLLIGASLLAAPAFAADSSDIRITIDNVDVASDVAPAIINQRTMVPVRVISESLAADVAWSGNQIVITTFDATVITMHLDSTAVTVKTAADTAETTATLDVKPVVINNRTLVPLRFIAETMNAQVDYTPQPNSAGSVTVDTPNLVIDGKTVSSMMSTTYMTTENFYHAYTGDSNINAVYDIITSGIGQEVSEPEYVGRNPNLDTEYFYYYSGQMDFWATDQTPSAEGNGIASYRYYRYISDNPDATAPAEFGDALIQDLNTSKWYRFSPADIDAIYSIIDKLYTTPMHEELFL